jgi:hypothetical protein
MVGTIKHKGEFYHYTVGASHVVIKDSTGHSESVLKTKIKGLARPNWFRKIMKIKPKIEVERWEISKYIKSKY